MPEIPEGAKVPTDHAKPAVQIEAERDKTTTITWRDVEFTLPATIDDADVDAFEAFEQGKIVQGTRGLLGPKEYAKFKALKPNVRDLKEFSDVLARAMGVDTVGE